MLVINRKPQPIPQQKGKKIYLVDLIPDGDLRKKICQIIQRKSAYKVHHNDDVHKAFVYFYSQDYKDVLRWIYNTYNSNLSIKTCGCLFRVLDNSLLNELINKIETIENKN